MQSEDLTFLLTMVGTLASFLAAVWMKVLRPAMKFIDRHEEVVKSIDVIEKEITCNGGGSLKASLHYSNTALFETDVEGNVVWTNEPFYDLTGLTLTDIEGFDWLVYIHEDDREEFLHEFKSCLKMNRRFSRSSRTSDNKNIRMVGFPYRINSMEHGGFLLSVYELSN